MKHPEAQTPRTDGPGVKGKRALRGVEQGRNKETATVNTIAYNEERARKEADRQFYLEKGYRAPERKKTNLDEWAEKN